MRRKPAWWWKQKSRLRSGSTEGRITDKPATIVLVRYENPLPPQEVRIEAVRQTDLSSRDATGMFVSSRQIVIFGYYDHPTQPDFDVQVDDLFTYNDNRYRIEGYTIHAGEKQAIAERIQ